MKCIAVALISVATVPTAKPQLRVTTDGRFLCVEVTNLGAPATFSAIIQPGRGTAPRDGVMLTLMWDSSNTGQALIKNIELDGDRALDPDTGDQFRVLDSPRHYHSKSV